MKLPCVHCSARLAQSRYRGLCRHCYDQPHIRGTYHRRTRQDETTEADLDRLIEEQRRALPPWWDSEVLKGYAS